LLGLVLLALFSQTSRAQWSDNFTNDNSLDPSLSTTSSSQLSSLAADFSSSSITPNLSFSAAGSLIRYNMARKMLAPEKQAAPRQAENRRFSAS